MILKSIEKEILQSQKRGEFIVPFYNKFCLSNVPATVADFFGISMPNSFFQFLPSRIKGLKGRKNLKVILLVLDGFGYYQWLETMNLPFFHKITLRGTLFPITSVFPSTTAASITALQTGLTPQEHALFEWFLYIKELDQIIMTLPFSPIKERVIDSLMQIGADPKLLLNREPIHCGFKRKKVPTFAFQKQDVAYSAYSKLAFRQSSVTAYKTAVDLISLVKKRLAATKGRGYFYVYWPDIDSISHKYGPGSEEYKAEVSIFASLWKKEFLEKIQGKTARNTIFIITADHGQIAVDAKHTIYLNKYPKLMRALKRSRNGKLIPPSGSPRDVFLHIKDGKLQEIYIYLSRLLGEKARVVLMEDAIREGLFGHRRVSEKFLERAGNLLILPKKNHTIWYEHVKGRKFTHRGHHGGLNKREMLIPLAIAKLSDLV